MTTNQGSLSGLRSKLYLLPANQSWFVPAPWSVRLTIAFGPKTGAIFTPANSMRQMIWLHCECCGVGFPRRLKEHQNALRKRASLATPQRTFCSQLCARNGLPIAAKRTCPECGGAKAPHAKLCNDCYATQLATAKVKLQCAQCAVIFDRIASEYEKAKRRNGEDSLAFCSQQCYQLHRIAYTRAAVQTGRECLTCKAPVTGRKRQKFCSHACYLESRRGGTPKDYKAYQGEWLQMRSHILHRDHLCRQCMRFGSTEVHHIDHDSTNHAATNLIGLCRTCHSSYHAMLAPAQATWKQVYTALASM